jgi:transposase, IS30 family
MSHHHLTRDERVSLAAFLRAGRTQADCARLLGVNRSTVSRELKRSFGKYKVSVANKKAKLARKKSKRKERKIENNKKLATKIISFLKLGWSPEQIYKKVRLVSDETIYTWIRRSRKDLSVLLPQRGRIRHQYGKKQKGGHQGWTKFVQSIETRPQSAENRSWIGHWEGDTIVGRDRARLLTHVDRKSRFLVATILPNGHAETVHAAAVRAFKNIPCRSITYDRGSEFALWRLIERDTGATVYFARAHAPWERGTNENTNGLLRRSFPKGTPLGAATARAVVRAVWEINHRPRKCLNWKTPCQVFGRCCVSS